jgi:hypothetical protein
MDIEIETSLKQLKVNFIKIGGLRTDITQTFQMVEHVIKELNDVYSEYIKNTKDKMMVFGLNPFYFQCKLIKLEYDDMHRFYIAVTNRMYCEYYKLHKIMSEYVAETVKDNDSLKVNFMYKDFPVYKDLEPFKEYDFEIISKIHEVIISMIDFLFQHLVKKENHMKTNESRNKTGLLINNFVNTLNYEIVIMREKILLFIHDLGFFHKLHTQYLKRFYDKILLFNMQLNDDVQLNSNTKPQLPTSSPVITVTRPGQTQENGVILSMQEILDEASETSSSSLSNKTPSYARALGKTTTLQKNESKGSQQQQQQQQQQQKQKKESAQQQQQTKTSSWTSFPSKK